MTASPESGDRRSRARATLAGMDGFVAVEVVGCASRCPPARPSCWSVAPGSCSCHLDRAERGGGHRDGPAGCDRAATPDARPVRATLRALGPLRQVRITRAGARASSTASCAGRRRRPTVVDARPSDAIALALRAGVPVLVAQEVLAEAGVRSRRRRSPGRGRGGPAIPRVPGLGHAAGLPVTVGQPSAAGLRAAPEAPLAPGYSDPLGRG